MYPQRHFSGIFTFFGSHTSEESQSSWNSHYLRYWRRWTFLLYHRGIYSGTIHWHFCVISKNFPWTFNKIWHPALWYFRLSASFNAISNPISGSKTRAYYSMWKSDKINRFWNCIFFYRFWKKLSNLRNNGFCCAGGSEWSSSNAFRRCVWTRESPAISEQLYNGTLFHYFSDNHSKSYCIWCSGQIWNGPSF